MRCDLPARPNWYAEVKSALVAPLRRNTSKTPLSFSTNSFKTFAISGYIRGQAESDDSLNRLSQESGYLKRYAII